MVQLGEFPTTEQDDGTYTIEFDFEGSGIGGVSTPQAIFDRAARAVAELEGTDSDLHETFDTDAKTLTVTTDQLRDITRLMKRYEETEAGFGEDKMMYESRTVLNNLHGRLRR